MVIQSPFHHFLHERHKAVHPKLLFAAQ